MIEGFSKSAHRVLIEAREEARMLSAPLVGTEHLLLGLMDEGVAGVSLANLGVSGELVRSAIMGAAGVSESQDQRATLAENIGEPADDDARHAEVLLARQGEPWTSHASSFTPPANRVLKLAVGEAENLRDSHVRPEHLLLALVADGGGLGAHVLLELGHMPLDVRREVLNVLLGSMGEGGERDGRVRPLLTVGRDVTYDARMGRIAPAIGWKRELELVMQILTRRKRVGLALIENGGANLISIVEALAELIILDDAPSPLMNSKLYLLDAGELMRSDDQRDLGNAIRGAGLAADGNTLVALTGVAAYLRESPDHATDLSRFVVAPVEDGTVRILLLINAEDYRDLVESDAGLSPLFESVEVAEPSVAHAVEMIKSVREQYEVYHRVYITDSAIFAAAQLATRYATEGFLPGTAVNLLDDACARTQIRQLAAPPEVEEIDRQISEVRLGKEAAIDAADFETAAELRDDEKQLILSRDDLVKMWRVRNHRAFPEVDDDTIIEAVMRSSGRSEGELRRALGQSSDAQEQAEPESPASFCLLNDAPISAADQDLLGTFTGAAADISSLLTSVPTPFVFAIDASWGMGKSSLLRQLEKVISSDGATTTIHFNAWTAQGDQTLEALIRSVLQALDPNIVRRTAKRVAEHRGTVTVARIAFFLFGRLFGVSRLIDGLWNQLGGYARSRNELRGAIHAMLTDWVATSTDGEERRLVVFVDDVDRCSDAAIVQLCEAIKLYLDAPGLVFVLACDMGVVARGVGDAARGGEGEGRAYLEKIVQVAYRFRPPTDEAVQRLIRGYATISGTLHLMDESIMDILVARCGGNPRRVKRIINSFVLENELDEAWGSFPLERVQLIRVILLQHLYTYFFDWILREEAGEDPIGDFLQYVSFRDRASNPVGRSERWWADAARLFQRHGLAAPTSRTSQDQIPDFANALNQVLPPWFSELSGDTALVSLLEGMGDAWSRRAVRAHLLSRPLQV